MMIEEQQQQVRDERGCLQVIAVVSLGEDLAEERRMWQWKVSWFPRRPSKSE